MEGVCGSEIRKCMRNVYGEGFDTTFCLKDMIKFKQSGLFLRKVMLIYNNAQPHAAEFITAPITSPKWYTFQPAYSSDIITSNFWVFPGLEEFLGGKRFQTEAKLQAKVNVFFKKMGAEGYVMSIHDLVLRYNKCLNGSGPHMFSGVFGITDELGMKQV